MNQILYEDVEPKKTDIKKIIIFFVIILFIFGLVLGIIGIVALGNKEQKGQNNTITANTPKAYRGLIRLLCFLSRLFIQFTFSDLQNFITHFF